MGMSYFISDAHLGAESQEKERAKREKLLSFLDYTTSAENLFILGDFFDFWFDYKTVIFREYFDILCKLAELVQKGVKVHFFGGNHDWWAFEGGILSEIGVKVYHSPAEIVVDGKKFFMGHGDGIAPSDWGYRNFLAPLLRNRVSVFLFRLVPPPMAWWISRAVSFTSKLYTQKRNLRLEEEYREFAARKIAENFDFVVFGHLHIPILEKIGGGVYANSGDFFQNFTYLVFDGQNLELKRWER